MTSPPSSSEETGASSNSSSRSSSFELLHAKVQRWIWEKNWRELRDVQERAIPPILEERDDVILSAATAGGKTEAAFLPIASALMKTPSRGPGIACIYVSPLKALINDQYGRLEDLCEHMEIPVHRWHGDVSADRKRSTLRNPSGLLLITPESIEALLVLRGTAIPGLFCGLRYVVIDELHSFLGSERGRQLQSLLHRIEQAIGRRVPRIGLSATLGDMVLAAEFLRLREATNVRMIVDRGGEGHELRLQFLGHRVPAVPPIEESKRPREGRPNEDREADSGTLDGVCTHLFGHLRGEDNLVFCNSRSMVERISDRLRRLSDGSGVPNEFHPHHGSLAKPIREDVETRLKESGLPLTAVCTSTLEMGIDIGSVESVAQIGCPPSVASMRQRLGRAGRRGRPAILRQYTLEDELTSGSSLYDLLRVETVQTIAMIELLLERWCEPPEPDAFHYSTLVQQVLSMIAQHGGIRVAAVWQILCGAGPFANVDSARFAALLRSLGDHDLITQMGDGSLVLGLKGERIVNHYQFYTAFTTVEEYRIVHGSRTLGNIPLFDAIQEGEQIIFAGQRWKVAAIDTEARVIEVLPSAGGRVPRFGGQGGPVHDRVRKKMKEIYEGTTAPAYLSAGARDLLREGRDSFARRGLREKRITHEGTNVALFPWSGNRIMTTLKCAFAQRRQQVELDGVAVVIERTSTEEVQNNLRGILDDGAIDTIALARSAKDPAPEKYDSFVPQDLAAENLAARRLDSDGTLRVIREILEGGA